MRNAIEDLLQRMSLADKVGQLNHPQAHIEVSTGAGDAVVDIGRHGFDRPRLTG